ncbi:syntaxin 6 [Rhodotorula toruloides]|uniref:Syntaxin 6 n=1 Tax=Rhodotorula toruloides TaxID=5286 RepID=A0A511KAE3_RHOTO|nr:syntaxin 6 [Rhodotorula toruloides]
MSQDPYDEVKADVETSLAQLHQLAATVSRYSRSGASGQHADADSELQWAIAELRANLRTIEPDLEEVEESVAAVAEPGVAARLGISDKEVQARRDFVDRVKGEVAAIRRQIPSQAASPVFDRKRHSATYATYPPSYRTANPLNSGEDATDDPNSAFEAQHQTLLMEQQDRTLTDIAGTVGLLREQAHLMGREVYEQNQLLDELDQQVDSTSGRLAKAQRRMDRFVRENNSTSNWLIFILMVALSILLFIIIFV